MDTVLLQMTCTIWHFLLNSHAELSYSSVQIYAFNHIIIITVITKLFGSPEKETPYYKFFFESENPEQKKYI